MARRSVPLDYGATGALCLGGRSSKPLDCAGSWSVPPVCGEVALLLAGQSLEPLGPLRG